MRVFDLTTPPPPQSAAEPFLALVLLPGGKTLTFEARSARVDYSTMDIVFKAVSLDEGRDHFLATAREFGLDAGHVESWYVRAQAVTALPVRSRWLRTTLGYLTFEVRASHMPTRTDVHYVLSWTVSSPHVQAERALIA